MLGDSTIVRRIKPALFYSKQCFSNSGVRRLGRRDAMPKRARIASVIKYSPKIFKGNDLFHSTWGAQNLYLHTGGFVKYSGAALMSSTYLEDIPQACPKSGPGAKVRPSVKFYPARSLVMKYITLVYCYLASSINI